MFNRFRASSEASEAPSVFSGSSRSTSASSVGSEARVRHRHVFLTYSQCTIESKDEFEKGICDMLERIDYPTASYYGCREHHKSGDIHYHVLLNLGKQPNWSYAYARTAFFVKGNECESLLIDTLQHRNSRKQFVENHVKYCEKEKGGDCFGERPEFAVGKQKERKRERKEIGSQSTAPAKLAKLKEEKLT